VRATRSRVAELVAGPIERASSIDPLLEPVQSGVRRFLPEESLAAPATHPNAQLLAAVALPPLRPAAFFWAVVPP
jgi:hypothetical protein